MFRLIRWTSLYYNHLPVRLACHQNSTTIQLQIEKNKIDLDLQLAQNIQNLLLPSNFPKNIPLEFAAHYLPAQKIGGDLYDVFEIDADSIGVAIADVSGKAFLHRLLWPCAKHT